MLIPQRLPTIGAWTTCRRNRRRRPVCELHAERLTHVVRQPWRCRPQPPRPPTTYRDDNNDPDRASRDNHCYLFVRRDPAGSASRGQTNDHRTCRSRRVFPRARPRSLLRVRRKCCSEKLLTVSDGGPATTRGRSIDHRRPGSLCLRLAQSWRTVLPARNVLHRPGPTLSPSTPKTGVNLGGWWWAGGDTAKP